MADNQNNVLVPNQQYRNQIETYGIGNPASLPLLVEALRQYVLSLPIEPDKGLAEKVAALETAMSQVQENVSSIEDKISGINTRVETNEQNITTLQTDTGELENDIAGIKGDIGNAADLMSKSKQIVTAYNQYFKNYFYGLYSSGLKTSGDILLIDYTNTSPLSDGQIPTLWGSETASTDFQNMPPNSPSTAFYFVREIIPLGITNNGDNRLPGWKFILKLTEVYPSSGRQYYNTYDSNSSSWAGWKKIEVTNAS